jgi:SpoVK/Ycf46/Vps4 family AAA+-type ATPase
MAGKFVSLLTIHLLQRGYTLTFDIITAFFMRKGADCLSKWVGEAERQLRLLFEEAKNCQPSIIFFDEIDGTFFSPGHPPSD